MIKRLWKLVAVPLLLTLAACGGSQSALKNNPAIQKVAVVSLAVSDWGGSVKYGSVGQTPVAELMQNATNDMLAYTEKLLGSRWQVVPAKGFIADSRYRKEGVEKTLNAYVPKLKGKEMPLFTQNSRQLKRVDIAPAKAQALCTALGVDAVVLVFSEWTAKTGGMIPMTKAVTKNLIGFWDKQGNKIFFKRLDQMGSRPLGALGIKTVNQETIEEWSMTYMNALDTMLRGL